MVSKVLNPAIHARYIRILPYSWHSHIALRLELLGCLSVVPGRHWSFAFRLSTYSLLVSIELQLIMAKHLTDRSIIDTYSAVLTRFWYYLQKTAYVFFLVSHTVDSEYKWSQFFQQESHIWPSDCHGYSHHQTLSYRGQLHKPSQTVFFFKAKHKQLSSKCTALTEIKPRSLARGLLTSFNRSYLSRLPGT